MPPLYDYKCPECGATREKLEPYSAKPPLCHSCRKTAMHDDTGMVAYG